MIRLIAALILATTTPALVAADTLPALYDVTSVEADDSLNIRSGPGSAFDVIGALAHDATGIEVTEVNEDMSWGRINIDERSGWVSLRFMKRVPQENGSTQPGIATCFGTEPFWSVEVTDTTLTFSSQDGAGYSEALEGVVNSRNYRNRHAFLADTMTLVVSHATCSDGMSDRHYGLQTDLIVTGAGSTELMSGCCSLAR